MEKTRHYQHLTPEDRAVIAVSLSYGLSVREISRTLRRAPSTISRELRRLPNHQPYDAPRTKLQTHTELFRYVRDRLLYLYWSPQQIAARLRDVPPSSLPDQQRVSHETIHAYLYAQPCGSLKKNMIQTLRQHKPERGRRRTTLASKRSFVPEELRIQHRPAEIEGRLVPGHREGDFIKDAYNRSAVGMLSERKTRFVILCKTDGCTADDALEGFVRQMNYLPAFLRSSLTYDRGSEMACFEQLSHQDTSKNLDFQ